jgi:ribosomal protein L11 methyltransferase
MEWLEVSVTADNEAAEAVAEVLSRYAHRGVVIEAGPEGWNAGPVVVRAYLPADDQLWANQRRIERALGHLDGIRPVSVPTFRPVAEEDWAEVWKDRLNVLRIGQRIVIRPSWQDHGPGPGDVVIQLDPGMAFGTGLHPTTQMCLSALEEHVQSGMEVLDLGTGSGILAIAAARLKAKHVLAVDHDKQAARVAYTNVVANRVQETVTVRQGSLQDVSGRYDLVVVNILARVIVEMVQQGLSERVRPDGVVITAGITVEQVPDVVEACERGGLELVDRKQSGDWVSLLAKRT